MQNKCVPYWPDLQSSKEVGRYVVTSKSEREAADYKVRVLEMCPVDKVTSKQRPLTLTLLWLCYADIMVCLLMYSLFFFPFGSQTRVVPSGTTSTWAGLTMASLRSQVVSSASSLKWTLNRENILMLGPWSSTAGTGLLEHKCLNKHRLETQCNDCRIPEQNTPVTVDTFVCQNCVRAD